ncbi:DEKNAAC101658 [Brettanomyces naardenensis]|uniref:DEKNAAC101658 n=1 Tax=Brettanomyces naardenensis TaxID=13370 RepID=A0A448YIQ5_BRENA|nr:DEKNAAC101658 [Brettanomyces naardenensis]
MSLQSPSGGMSSKFSRRIVESVLSRHSNRYKPVTLSAKDVNQSPVFQRPAKWISKPSLISRRSRIESYKPLEQCPFASSLASPPRMTYMSRIIIPRDLLVRMQLTKNNITEDSPLAYLLTPSIEGKKKPTDPILYYPKDLQTFRNITTKHGDKGVTKVSKVYFLAGVDFGVSDKEQTGWLAKTEKVVDLIEFAKLTDSFERLETAFPSFSPAMGDGSDSAIILSFGAADHPFSYAQQLTVFNLQVILKDHKELYDRLVSYFKPSSTMSVSLSPDQDHTASFLAHLYEYSVLLGMH